MIRPRVRLPLWSVIAIPAAVYVVRSIALRGGDFALDMPEDVIAAVTLLIAVAAAAVIRARYQSPDEQPEPFGSDGSNEDTQRLG